jgi:methyl-accepting chemotaxis protein
MPTNDGKAVLNGTYSSDFDITKESFYRNALSKKDELGSEYVNYQNKSFLFIYSKLSIGNATVFALIPKTEVVKQAAGVKSITIIIVPVSRIL